MYETWLIKVKFRFWLFVFINCCCARVMVPGLVLRLFISCHFETLTCLCSTNRGLLFQPFRFGLFFTFVGCSRVTVPDLVGLFISCHFATIVFVSIYPYNLKATVQLPWVCLSCTLIIMCYRKIVYMDTNTIDVILELIFVLYFL